MSTPPPSPRDRRRPQRGRARGAGLRLALWLAVGLASFHAGASPDEGLRRAEAQIARGDEAAAAEIYRELLERGHDGAGLRYNLGTLRLAEGAIGHAVLHLRSALRLDPTLEDAAHNLAVALEGRGGLLAATETAGPEHSLPGLSPSTVALVLWLSLAALALGFGLWPWLPSGRPRRAALVCCACALVSTLGSALLHGAAWSRFHRAEVVVLAPVAVGRAAPDAQAQAAFEVRAGAWGAVVERSGAFVRVRLPQGLDAWLPGESVAEVGSVPPPPPGS